MKVDILFWILLITAVVLGVTAVFLYRESMQIEATIIDGRKKVMEMEKMYNELKLLPKTSMNTDQKNVNSYLFDKVVNFGVSNTISTPTSPKTTGSWHEYIYTINIPQRKENPVVKGTLVTMLETIERERPFIKTKSLNLTLKNDAVWGIVTISSFVKK